MNKLFLLLLAVLAVGATTAEFVEDVPAVEEDEDVSDVQEVPSEDEEDEAEDVEEDEEDPSLHEEVRSQGQRNRAVIRKHSRYVRQHNAKLAASMRALIRRVAGRFGSSVGLTSKLAKSTFEQELAAHEAANAAREKAEDDEEEKSASTRSGHRGKRTRHAMRRMEKKEKRQLKGIKRSLRRKDQKKGLRGAFHHLRRMLRRKFRGQKKSSQFHALERKLRHLHKHPDLVAAAMKDSSPANLRRVMARLAKRTGGSKRSSIRRMFDGLNKKMSKLGRDARKYDHRMSATERKMLRRNRRSSRMRRGLNKIKKLERREQRSSRSRRRFSRLDKKVAKGERRERKTLRKTTRREKRALRRNASKRSTRRRFRSLKKTERRAGRREVRSERKMSRKLRRRMRRNARRSSMAKKFGRVDKSIARDNRVERRDARRERRTTRKTGRKDTRVERRMGKQTAAQSRRAEHSELSAERRMFKRTRNAITRSGAHGLAHWSSKHYNMLLLWMRWMRKYYSHLFSHHHHHHRHHRHLHIPNIRIPRIRIPRGRRAPSRARRVRRRSSLGRLPSMALPRTPVRRPRSRPVRRSAPRDTYRPGFNKGSCPANKGTKVEKKSCRSGDFGPRGPRNQYSPDKFRELLARFAPEMRFHPREAYFPTSINTWLRDAYIKTNRGNVPASKENLKKYGKRGASQYQSLKRDFKDQVLYGNPPKNNRVNAPVYVRGYTGADGATYLEYMLFYSYSGPQNVRFKYLAHRAKDEKADGTAYLQELEQDWIDGPADEEDEDEDEDLKALDVDEEDATQMQTQMRWGSFFKKVVRKAKKIKRSVKNKISKIRRVARKVKAMAKKAFKKTATVIKKVAKVAGKVAGKIANALGFKYVWRYGTLDPAGTHMGDFEGLTLKISKDFQRVEDVFMRSHGDSRRFPVCALTWTGDHPIFYVAHNSHAMYPTPGVETLQKLPSAATTFFALKTKGMEFIDDHRGGGAVWQPWTSGGGGIEQYGLEAGSGDRRPMRDFPEQAAWYEYRNRWGAGRHISGSNINFVTRNVDGSTARGLKRMTKVIYKTADAAAHGLRHIRKLFNHKTLTAISNKIKKLKDGTGVSAYTPGCEA